jgi:hypothetical protein
MLAVMLIRGNVLVRIQHCTRRTIAHFAIRIRVLGIRNSICITSFLGGRVAPICLGAIVAAKPITMISHAVRIGLVANAGIGNVIPIFQYLIIAAALIQIFEKLTIQGEKLCTRNHNVYSFCLFCTGSSTCADF